MIPVSALAIRQHRSRLARCADRRAHHDPKSFRQKLRFLLESSVVDFNLARYHTLRVNAEVQCFFRRLAADFTTPYWIDKTPS